MTEKKKKTEPDTIQVVLLATHTHQGQEYQKGDTITIRKRQLQRMQEWGKVK